MRMIYRRRSYLSPSTHERCFKALGCSLLKLFPPLKLCVADGVEFPDVLGEVLGDFHLFDCTEAEEPLREIPTSDDNWVYHVNSSRFPAAAPLVLSGISQEIGNFWITLNAPVHGRLSPFIRGRMSGNSDFDLWSSLLEALGILGELGESRDSEDARAYLDNLRHLPAKRDGKRCDRDVVFGKPIVLDDCATQEFVISPLSFTVVDYGNLIPTSVGLQSILRRT